MKIAVIGAGAIGNLIAGYLRLKDEDVSLVGHPESVKAIKEKGLSIRGVRGDFGVKLDISETLRFRPDLAILAVKTQDIESALKDNFRFLKDTTILTTQNGVQADNLVAKYISKESIISSIVMFGATYINPGRVLHNFEGSWIMGKVFSENDDRVIGVSLILNKIFPTIVTSDLMGMKYLKVFVNANNCIAAILGTTMQEAFRDIDISRVSISIWKEGLEVINKAGINLVSLTDFPLEHLTKITSLPIDEAAKIYSGIMTNLSKEPLYGSILQSIKRGRPSEIDYINGEFVNIAKKSNFEAALNKRLVEMVHQVEKTKKFFSREELLNNVKQFLSPVRNTVST